MLPTREIENLENLFTTVQTSSLWGAVPGPMNESRWEKMTPGDVVLIYNNGRIRFAGEIAAKVRNKELARYSWKQDEDGSTWALMYFIVNEERTDVRMDKLNPLFGYQSHYHPQGFSMINETAVTSFAQNYGDILGQGESISIAFRHVLLVHFRGNSSMLALSNFFSCRKVDPVPFLVQVFLDASLRNATVWVPRNDQPKRYQGHNFRDFVVREFHQTLRCVSKHRKLMSCGNSSRTR